MNFRVLIGNLQYIAVNRVYAYVLLMDLEIPQRKVRQDTLRNEAFSRKELITLSFWKKKTQHSLLTFLFFVVVVLRFDMFVIALQTFDLNNE